MSGEIQGGEGQERPRSNPSSLYMMMTMLMLFVLIIPGLRTALGIGAGIVLEPIFAFNYAYPLYTLLATGILVTLINTFSRHYFADWIEMERMRVKTSAFNKVYREAVRKQDMNKIEKLKKMQMQNMAEQMEVQGRMMKATTFTMIIVIAIFSWLWIFLSDKVDYTLVAIPWSNSVNLLKVSFLFPNWLLIYSALTMPLAWVVTYIFKFLEFRRKLESYQEEGAVQ